MDQKRGGRSPCAVGVTVTRARTPLSSRLRPQTPPRRQPRHRTAESWQESTGPPETRPQARGRRAGEDEAVRLREEPGPGGEGRPGRSRRLPGWGRRRHPRKWRQPRGR